MNWPNELLLNILLLQVRHFCLPDTYNNTSKTGIGILSDCMQSHTPSQRAKEESKENPAKEESKAEGIASHPRSKVQRIIAALNAAACSSVS